MPVLLVPWASGPRDSRGGLRCRSQARLLGRNGEGLGRRACDEHLGGQGPSEFGWWQQRGGQAGGCGLRSPRARNIYRARTRDRCALFRARAAQSAAPCAGPVGRARRVGRARMRDAVSARDGARPPQLHAAAASWPQAQRGCCLLRAGGCRPRAAMGGIETRMRAGTVSGASVHIPPVTAKISEHPMCDAGRVHGR